MHMFTYLPNFSRNALADVIFQKTGMLYLMRALSLLRSKRLLPSLTSGELLFLSTFSLKSRKKDIL